MLHEKLKQLEETTLLELLEITTQDLLDQFWDRVVDKEEWLWEQLEEKDLDE